MLLRGEAGRLWVLSNIEEDNFQYLWFDQYGKCQVLEFKIAQEPNLVIPDKSLLLTQDSCVSVPVLLNGLPYLMTQCDDGWITGDETIDEAIQLLTCTFIPDEENFEWYRQWNAFYNTRTGEMSWALSETFIPNESHPLNGSWQSLSDSLIILNGQTYQMNERSVFWDYLSYSLRELMLNNTDTGDSIRLFDACFPPYVDSEKDMLIRKEGGYEQWIKKRGKDIKKSILLKGEKYKLYEVVTQGKEHFWAAPSYAYFDDSGFNTPVFPSGKGVFRDAIHGEFDWSTLWYQKGDTVINGVKFTITQVLSSGDTIILRDENNKELLYIDTKLPSLKSKK
jgi:hypothetical protein